MSTITTISAARSNLFNIANMVIESHEPMTLTSKRGNVVIISEDDFRSIQETLYLQSIPGLVEDVKAGMSATDDEFVGRDDLPW